MKANARSVRGFAGRFLTVAATVGFLGAAIVMAVPPAADRPLEAPAPQVAASPDGKELFAREWIAGDPRSRGDGLGPMFNDTSCVACHNQGGPGGGGPFNKNVQILTTSGQAIQQQAVQPSGGSGGAAPQSVVQQSFVLHLFSTDPEFAKWRAAIAQSATAPQVFSGAMGATIGTIQLDAFDLVRVQTAPGQATQVAPTAPRVETRNSAGGSQPAAGQPVAATGIISGSIMIAGNQISQRNATALFGSGKIDAINDEVLEKAALRKYPKFPQVAGRVARDDKGRVGRFGWKAQKASLDDFVLTACAVELGLQVPGHDQPPLPHKPEYKAKGLDLTKTECDALVRYVGSLPPPVQQRVTDAKHTEYLTRGKAIFEAVGCATCHTPKLGDADGLYSDLLLHDMGPSLTDIGSSYGIFQPNPPPTPTPVPGPQEVVQATKVKHPPVVATPQEWRTPPLWGVRDSAPYLHDGRANTLEDAIALHGGQAQESAKQFATLTPQEKQKLVAFLKSLVAPGERGT